MTQERGLERAGARESRSTPKVAVGGGDPRLVGTWGQKSSSQIVSDVDGAWGWLGWFGGVITAVGLFDFALAWYPLQLGVPEWEFGTIAASFAGLPLVTIGLAALLASMVARGRRIGIFVVAGLLLVLALWIAAALVLFALDIPVALRVVAATVSTGLKKAIAKTLVLGAVFSAGYLIAAVAALRHAKRARPGGRE